MNIYFLKIIFLNLILFINFKKISKFYNLFDYPDKIRKKHKKPTPLLGGLIIFLNLFVFCLSEYLGLFDFNYFENKNKILIFFFFSFLFFLIGFIDDKYSIKPNLKLLIYILLITFLMFLDKDLTIKHVNFSFSSFIFDLNNFGIFFSILCFLLFINSFNMLDGINGQAATYSIYILILFIFYNINLSLSVSFILALLIFLYFNFKDKMFLGDSGTILLGFIISYFFVKSYNLGTKIFSDEIFLIMMIPGYELVRLAVQRMLKKKHPFSPDNAHIHHLLSKRVKFFDCYLYIQLLIIFPFAFYYITSSSLISLLTSSIIYISLIFLISKKKD